MPPESMFIASLRSSAKKIDKNCFVLKMNDSVSIGVPDLVLVILGEVFWLECKAMTDFFKSPRFPDSDTPVLKHPFSGPQIGMMRQISRAGANVMGVIRVSSDVAYVVDPMKIPSGGNFTYAQLQEKAVMVKKENHTWMINEWPKSLL
jgi:hypothetical protein